jgi:ferredoxin-NADP reductase
MHNSAFDHAEQLVNDIWTFYFTIPPGYTYLAGQYAEVIVAHSNTDNRGDSRTLTFSSSPTEKLLAVTIKIPQHCSSYKQALSALLPGDTVRISEPMGDLVLPIQAATPLVFIAGGIGIASFRGMLKYLADTPEQRNITLHYALRTVHEKIFSNVIAESPAKQHIYESKSQRLGVTAIIEKARPESIYYVSGSEAFTMQIKDTLLAQGISSTNIVFDFYDGYAEL